MTLVLGIQVLNQHEGHSGIGRQMAEQFRECFEAARGSAYADDWECTDWAVFHRDRTFDSHRGDRLSGGWFAIAPGLRGAASEERERHAR